MDPVKLAETGTVLFVTRLFLTSLSFVWVYDYFSTLADEIKYAWFGKRSWIFALFIANRYIPLLYIIWINIVMFVNAKLISYGAYSSVRFTVVPFPQLPEALLNLFRLCVYQRWRLGAYINAATTLSFDVLAFLIILVRAKRIGTSGYPGVLSLLKTILRDSTVYFIFISLVQLLALLVLFVASGVVQILPGVIYAFFAPIMATRLMLSLKKAAAEPAEPWSLGTMSDFCSRGPPGGGTLRFAPHTFYVSQEISETPTVQNEEAIELEFTSRAP